jgi:hypothetical protein
MKNPGWINPDRDFLFLYQNYIFLVVSFLLVSVLAVSVAAGAGALWLVESIFVLSDPSPAFFSELQLVAIAPIIAATSAKLKNCFFIVICFKLNYQSVFEQYYKPHFSLIV